MSQLLDPTFPFRFEVAIRQFRLEWQEQGLELPDACRMASWGALAERPLYADVRMAWSPAGLGFSVRTTGKRQLPWCRESRPAESDGFQLLLDTRCSPNIHRANRYCHRFHFMPIGGGAKRDRPYATLLAIHRARQVPTPVSPRQLRVAARLHSDGYQLSGMIPATALTGFDPLQQPRVSLWYAVIDREKGWQTFTLGPEFPVCEDPSLWGEAVLDRRVARSDNEPQDG
ncbi:DOMON domain-containing protein [Roseimaritima sediminicola]|uniref:hypothetical protein n=1 Tax=Roseimaritima sediminicola TaxID=2662066 RepID=UPI001F19698A|nr:hypothetical protein [Roseimaritima sediminicola]